MNWDKIQQLIAIVEGANPTRWPKLRPIHEAAMAELEAIANPPAPKPAQPKPEPTPEEETTDDEGHSDDVRPRLASRSNASGD